MSAPDGTRLHTALPTLRVLLNLFLAIEFTSDHSFTANRSLSLDFRDGLNSKMLSTSLVVSRRRK